MGSSPDLLVGYQDHRGDLNFRYGHVDKGSDSSLRKTAIFFLISLILLSSVPNVKSQVDEDSKSITFQPSEIPNIEFSYNQEEYQFELTWKNYYLNVKPFAIYNGQYYYMKQIIPFLKNQYPNVDYQTAIQKFKNYHRWGFWLEKLPQNVADNLDYLGFDISDNNIPLDKVEIEDIEYEIIEYEVRTYKKIHIGNRFTLDFYDLIEHGFTFELNRTTILIGNVTGKTDLDLDPITYSAPSITVEGFTLGTPCTFWDVWNASYVNGWNVGYKPDNTNLSYTFNATIYVDDGSWPPSYFGDENKIVAFVNKTKFLPRREGHIRLGEVVNETLKTTKNGVTLITDLEVGTGTNFIYMNGVWRNEVDLYGCTIMAPNGNIGIMLGDYSVCWNSHFIGAIIGQGARGDFYHLTIMSPIPIWRPSIASYEDITIIEPTGYVLYRPYSDILKMKIINPQGATMCNLHAPLRDLHFIDFETDLWTFTYGTFNYKVYRQYTFNLKVVDKDGAPINNANVTLSNEDETNAFNVLTHENGSITKQTVTRGYYNKTMGSTLVDYGPFYLTVTCDDYESISFIFNVSEPIDWTLSLRARAGVIESDAPWIAIAIILSVIAFLLAMRVKR